MMLPGELEIARALADNSSAGPWCAYRHGAGWGVSIGAGPDGQPTGPLLTGGGFVREADAKLTAAARTLIPQLINEVEEGNTALARTAWQRDQLNNMLTAPEHVLRLHIAQLRAALEKIHDLTTTPGQPAIDTIHNVAFQALGCAPPQPTPPPPPAGYTCWDGIGAVPPDRRPVFHSYSTGTPTTVDVDVTGNVFITGRYASRVAAALTAVVAGLHRPGTSVAIWETNWNHRHPAELDAADVSAVGFDDSLRLTKVVWEQIIANRLGHHDPEQTWDTLVLVVRAAPPSNTPEDCTLRVITNTLSRIMKAGPEVDVHVVFASHGEVCIDGYHERSLLPDCGARIVTSAVHHASAWLLDLPPDISSGITARRGQYAVRAHADAAYQLTQLCLTPPAGRSHP